MTPEEHNKYLAYSHFGYAAFQLLMLIAMTVFSFLIFGLLTADDTNGDFPKALVAAILIFSSIIQLLFSVPSIIAGFGLLKKRSWAKTAGLIAGVLSAVSFPIGTAVCVYTFWFLLGSDGKELYERPLGEVESQRLSFLSEGSGDNLAADWTKRQREYVPPREMPNWRD